MRFWVSLGWWAYLYATVLIIGEGKCVIWYITMLQSWTGMESSESNLLRLALGLEKSSAGPIQGQQVGFRACE